MFTRPNDLSDPAVADALRTGWGMTVGNIEYAPVGFGSHHWKASANSQRWFVTVDDLDARQRDVLDTRDTTATRLTSAFSSARAPRAGDLGFVIAPQPTGSGDVAHRVNDRYLATLYEHVDGTTYDWGAYDSHADRLEVLDRLAAIHKATATVRGIAPVDNFVIRAVTPAELFEFRERSVAQSQGIMDTALASGGFDQPGSRTWPDGHSPSIRWILVHLIEKYARHNGHADLLGEVADGATGE